MAIIDRRSRPPYTSGRDTDGTRISSGTVSVCPGPPGLRRHRESPPPASPVRRLPSRAPGRVKRQTEQEIGRVPLEPAEEGDDGTVHGDPIFELLEHAADDLGPGRAALCREGIDHRGERLEGSDRRVDGCGRYRISSPSPTRRTSRTVDPPEPCTLILPVRCRVVHVEEWHRRILAVSIRPAPPQRARLGRYAGRPMRIPRSCTDLLRPARPPRRHLWKDEG